MKKVYIGIGLLFSSIVFAESLHAQCANCGAAYNKTDRAASAREAENQRLQRLERGGVRPDPLGNALIGGGVSGVLRGSVGAAAGAFRNGVATGAAANKPREISRKGK